ncbi:MAG: hypothetical protein Rhirs2KO_18660 [Rhizobiaceae bacterium]
MTPKPPKWLRKGQKLTMEAEIVHVSEDCSYFAVQMPNGQRSTYTLHTAERAIERGEIAPKP